MAGNSIVYRYSPNPDTLYLNITNRCSNNCSFCVRNFSSGLSGYNLWLQKEPTANEIWSGFQKERKPSDRKTVWCGFGEPTIRLNELLTITQKIKKYYPHIYIRLNTDGLAQARNPERNVAQELGDAGIDSISISLNAENQKKYDQLCNPTIPGSYRSLLKFAKNCKKHIPEVRLTAVYISGINLRACEKIAKQLGCSFKIR